MGKNTKADNLSWDKQDRGSVIGIDMKINNMILVSAIVIAMAIVPTSAAHIKEVANGFILYNMTRYDNGNLTLNNQTFSIDVNYLTPNSIGLSVNRISYEFFVGQTQEVMNSTGNDYYINLTGINWAPISHTFNMELYDIVKPSKAPAQTVAGQTTTIPQAIVGSIQPTNHTDTVKNSAGAAGSLYDYYYEIAAVLVIVGVAVIGLVMYAMRKKGMEEAS